MKKRSKLPFIFLIFLLLLSNVGNYWYFNIYQPKDYQSQIENLSTTLEKMSANVYVAVSDIPAGTIVSESLVTPATRTLENTTGLFTASDIGKSAVNLIPANSTMMSAFVYNADVDSDNLCEFNIVELPEGTLSGSFIDVRIHYPNGEEYTVVSKATAVTVLSNSLVQLRLSETEQQYMASAEEDKHKYGADIRATIYADATATQPHKVTYLPATQTLGILLNEKLITASEYSSLKSSRTELETRVSSVLVLN